MNTRIFEEREANVRSYCRAFPDVFQQARGALVYGESGKVYIDFFMGAGALNYGHNNPYIKQQILSHLVSDGIMHALDMYTDAKRSFLGQFWEKILAPRKLDYKVMFCGPTGTNAVEAALKLARKIKQRNNVFSFMGGYHGLSLGSLALTGNKYHRDVAGIPLGNVTFIPYPASFMGQFDTIDYMETILEDSYSGIDKPAAIIFETVQAEGGVIVAPTEWMNRLRKLCNEHDILLICDDIQAGCGRTGSFFSFERAGIVPDMVTLSKSISGYGQPMSLLLFKSEHDVWEPGEHTGTFRGNQLAFVGATAAIEYFYQQNIPEKVREREEYLRYFLREEIATLSPGIAVRGIGMIWGIDVSAVGNKDFAQIVSALCFQQGLMIECAGRDSTVLKILPPLCIEMEHLQQGCATLKESLEICLQGQSCLT